MKKTFIIVIAIIFLFLNSTAQVNVQNDLTPAHTVSVQPMKNQFNLKAGESKEIKIYISNKLERKMQFNVYLGDWERDTMGEHVYNAPGTQPYSCSQWITIDKKFIEVDTAQIGIINLKLQIPDSASAVSGMKWAMLFIESVEESKAPENTKEMKSEIIPRTRFGVHIYQTPPNINEKEIRLLSFNRLTSKNDVFRLTCENTGKVQLDCKSYIELSPLSNGKKIVTPSLEVPLFPGQKRYLDFQIPSSIPKGKYTLVGVIDGGYDMDIEAAQMVVDIQ
jgi:hypothetical protein